MAQMEFEVFGLKEVQSRMAKAGDALVQAALNEGLRDIGRLIVPASGTGPLANETPKVSGDLAKSTVFQVIGGPLNQVLEVRQAARSPGGVFYGFIVREGRKAIEASQGKFLHFFIGDQEFFRKRVGPAKANPYHIRVLNRLLPGIQEIVNKMGRKVVGYISGGNSGIRG